MSWFEWMEFLSYAVTVVGLPFAIGVFYFENRRERQNDEEELHQRLTDQYVDFLKLVLDNADLQLLHRQRPPQKLSDEQKERQYALFEILVSLFEQAYILVFEEKMRAQTKRLWFSWEDYMREWCRQEDFRTLLPELLEGDDEGFRNHILKIAEHERAAGRR